MTTKKELKKSSEANKKNKRPCGCELKGFLNFLALKLIERGELCGEDIRREIEARRGSKPSPGTIYPVLKQLVNNNLIEESPGCDGKQKKYRITITGRREAKNATEQFNRMFSDLTKQ